MWILEEQFEVRTMVLLATSIEKEMDQHIKKTKRDLLVLTATRIICVVGRACSPCPSSQRFFTTKDWTFNRPKFVEVAMGRSDAPLGGPGAASQTGRPPKLPIKPSVVSSLPPMCTGAKSSTCAVLVLRRHLPWAKWTPGK